MSAPLTPVLVPDWPAEVAATHSPSDALAYRLDAVLVAHPEWCSTDADYPDWTPDGVR